MFGGFDVPREPPEVPRDRGGSEDPDDLPPLPKTPEITSRIKLGDEPEDPAQADKPGRSLLWESDDWVVQSSRKLLPAYFSEGSGAIDGREAESTPDPERDEPEQSEPSAAPHAGNEAAAPPTDLEQCDEPNERTEPEHATQPEPEVQAEPGPERRPGERAVPEVEAEPELGAQPELEADLGPELRSGERAEPELATSLEVEAETKSGAELRPERQAEPELEGKAEPAPELAPEERAEPETHPEIEPEADSEMWPVPETRREHISESNHEPANDGASARAGERSSTDDETGVEAKPVPVDTTADTDHPRELPELLPRNDLHEQRDVEKQYARLLNMIDRATGKDIGLPWPDAPHGVITEISRLVEVVREFAKRLSAHPLVGSRLPELAPDSAIASVQGYLDRIDGLLEELARLPAEILLLPDARGRIRGGTRIPPLANVEIRDSRGVAVGADCYVYVLHRCEMTATVELADVLAHDPDGIWLRWHDLSPFNADADTLAPRPVPLASPFSSAVDGCQGVTIGSGNSSTNVFEYRISCRQSARTYLAHSEVRAALRQCREDGLTDAERDQARDALRARILSVAARLQDDPEVINPEWRDLIPRGPVPKAVRKNGRIVVVNAKGVTVGYGNRIKGELQNRCEIVVR